MADELTEPIERSTVKRRMTLALSIVKDKNLLRADWHCVGKKRMGQPWKRRLCDARRNRAPDRHIDQQIRIPADLTAFS